MELRQYALFAKRASWEALAKLNARQQAVPSAAVLVSVNWLITWLLANVMMEVVETHASLNVPAMKKVSCVLGTERASFRMEPRYARVKTGTWAPNANSSALGQSREPFAVVTVNAPCLQMVAPQLVHVKKPTVDRIV